jgi:hypothetical protein
MSLCPQCGASTMVGQSFCGNCGASLAHVESEAERTAIRPVVPPVEPRTPAPEDPTVQLPVETPAQSWLPGFDRDPQPDPVPPTGPTPQYAAASTSPLANVDLGWLLKGNWLGAARTAGAAFGVALVLGLLVAFAGADDLDAASAFWTGLMLSANAFGANTIIDFSALFDADEAALNIGQYPLLATFLALGVAAFLFRRMTAGYSRVKDVLLDAVRSALLLSLLVTFVAIVVRIATPEIDGYESMGSSEADEVFGLFLFDGESKVSIAGAIFLPFLLMLVVLAAANVHRTDLWSGQLSPVQSWLAAPLAGVLAVLVALLGAGLLWTVAQVAGEKDARGFSEVVDLLAVLPAAGLHFVGLGVMSRIGETSSGDDARRDDWDRLADYADANGALFWLAPVAAVAVAGFGVWTVIRRSSDRSLVLRNLGVYLGMLVLVIPLLVRLANIHINLSAEGDGDSYDQDNTLGLDGFQTMALFLLLSALLAAVMMVVTGNLDVHQLKSKATAMARSVQTNPGQPRQQWGGPPPGPPGPPPSGPPGPPPPGPPPSGPPPQGPPPQGPPPSGPPPGWQPPPGPPPPGPPPAGPPPAGPPPAGPPPDGPPPGWQPPPGQ